MLHSITVVDMKEKVDIYHWQGTFLIQLEECYVPVGMRDNPKCHA